MSPAGPPELSTLEFHVLLALAGKPLYGYAIKDVISAESSGTLAPRAGSLYRVLGRLMVSGLLRIADPVGEDDPHPGLARRYYGLTGKGRKALATEAQRLKLSARMAEKRLGMPQSHS